MTIRIDLFWIKKDKTQNFQNFIIKSLLFWIFMRLFNNLKT